MFDPVLFFRGTCASVAAALGNAAHNNFVPFKKTVSPSDFFDMDARYPSRLRTMSEDLKKLDMDQLNAINAVIQTMKSRK